MPKRRGFADRRDKNEPEIIKALKAIGCSVHQLDQPLDLLVGYRGLNWLIEVKTDKGKLTEGQEEFLPEWRGQLCVARTPEQAIDIVCGKYKDRGSKIQFN